MNSISMAFLLTTLAGLSTMIGVIPIFINLKNKNKEINICQLLIKKIYIELVLYRC